MEVLCWIKKAVRLDP